MNPLSLRSCLEQSLLLALFFGTLLSGPAAADAFYVGAGAYVADINAANLDERDFTPAGFIGYQFLDTPLLMVSVEGGYYDLGEASMREGEPPVSFDASALTLAGVAYVPIGPFFEVYGKAGLARFSLDSQLGPASFSDDSTDPFVGVGAAFDFFDTVDIYAEYLYFENDIDSQMLGVGIRLDFF
ncbi:MAG: outer membrane beta-barrel protein [Pseudomonadota bacterium]